MNQDYWNKVAYQEISVDKCENEKIQNIGAVQSCAQFIVLDSDFKIVALSENADFVNQKPKELIGVEVFTLECFKNLSKDQLLTKSLKRIAGIIENQLLIITRNTHHYYIEIEPEKFEAGSSYNEISPEVLSDLNNVETEKELLQKSASSIKKISGYDRVMIYRFEPNGDGYVIAEEKNEDLEPFLDLRYPASDIPDQAKKLFLNSSSRIIVDVDSLPAPIICRKGLAPIDLDLSNAYFRATSPLHIEYLQNMGVKATFGIPIKVDGQLWGLVACHHYSKSIHLKYDLRVSCELVSSFINSKLQSIIQERKVSLKNKIFELSQDILNRITNGKTVAGAFEENGRRLLAATESSGFIMKMGNESIPFGQCPPNHVIEGLLEQLNKKNEVDAWFTTQSTKQGIQYDKDSVGILAVPLSINYKDYLIWFRPAAEQTINWAGKNNKKRDVRDRLSPRGSFNLWSEKISNQSLEWKKEHKEAARYILFSFVRDIFAKARQLSKANQKLEDISRSKDEFIGMVSHELRTPLNALVGWVKILKLSKLDPQGTEAAEVIERNTNIQINLIDDLLDISRIISGKMKMTFQKSIDLSKIVKEVVNDTKETAKLRNISIEFNDADKVTTSGDPDRLKQIVWNLVSNAIKYNHKNGSVVIAINKLASSIQLSVSDNGLGIAKDKLALIFDRFVQTKDTSMRSSGLGLGLAIVKSLVELHGGAISVSSAGLDKGSTFTVDLPVYAVEIETKDGEVNGASINAPELEEYHFEGIKVLILEDQPDAARALTMLLEKTGAEVTHAFNGKEGFSVFSSELDSPFDLILSDIGMPEWNGYEFIKELRALEKARNIDKTPAIALTAYASAQDRIACIKAGFQTHLPKPVNYHELFTVMGTLGIEKLEKLEGK